ncbi:hypothetical protein ORI99_08675, partial [Alishewanella sp. SMS9]|nr:hypothetical protein [Alishewanella sp. SMS9]
MFKKTVFLLTFMLLGCSQTLIKQTEKNTDTNNYVGPPKIQVLNLGSFHFGQSSDAHTVEFDEQDAANQQEVRAIAQLIARFKPTIICLEFLPEQTEQINQAY